MADVKRTELLKEEEALLEAQNKGKDVTDRLNEVCRVIGPEFIPYRYLISYIEPLIIYA